MVEKGQEDDFMKQCMDTCKEQIEKLASDPELLNQTLKPFMEISQLMAGGMLNGSMPGMISDSSSMNIDTMIRKIKEMVSYIESNGAQFANESDAKLKELYKYIKNLRKPIKEILTERGIIKKTES